MSDLIGDMTELEDRIAWGKEMKLETSYAGAGTGATPVRLGEIRKALFERYPQTGPIFA
jgi:hypothetical protein